MLWDAGDLLTLHAEDKAHARSAREHSASQRRTPDQLSFDDEDEEWRISVEMSESLRNTVAAGLTGHAAKRLFESR
jgi:hypothetical protein